MTGMIVTSLVAAGLYGAAAALEQRQAERAPEQSAGKLTLLVHLARNPLWLLGFAAQFGGFAVHAAALRSGPLDTVQMLIATELIVAVLLVQFRSGRKPSPSSAAAALTVVAGIAMFLFLTAPRGHGHGAEHVLPHLTLLAALLLGGSAAILALAGLRAAGCRRAILLALAAGAGDACSAVVTMAFTHALGHGLAAIMTSWTTYAVIVAGIANILLTQTAYQAGRPLVTLPLISAVVPVASVAVGVGLLGEAPRVGLASAVGAGMAVAVTSVGLAILARSAPAPSVAVVQAAPARRMPAQPVPAGSAVASAVPAQSSRPDGLQRHARRVRVGPDRQVRLRRMGQRVHAGSRRPGGGKPERERRIASKERRGTGSHAAWNGGSSGRRIRCSSTGSSLGTARLVNWQLKLARGVTASH